MVRVPVFVGRTLLNDVVCNCENKFFSVFTPTNFHCSTEIENISAAASLFHCTVPKKLHKKKFD